MERRKFLAALTAASLGVTFNGTFLEFARAEKIGQGEQSSGSSSKKSSSKTSEFPQNSTIVLVHAAWDLGALGRQDVWRINVEGSTSVLEGAVRAGVGRTIFISLIGP